MIRAAHQATQLILMAVALSGCFLAQDHLKNSSCGPIDRQIIVGTIQSFFDHYDLESDASAFEMDLEMFIKQCRHHVFIGKDLQSFGPSYVFIIGNDGIIYAGLDGLHLLITEPGDYRGDVPLSDPFPLIANDEQIINLQHFKERK